MFDLLSLVTDVQISSNLLRWSILWSSNDLQSLIKILSFKLLLFGNPAKIQHQIRYFLAFDLVSLVTYIQISSNLVGRCILWLSNYLQSLINIILSKLLLSKNPAKIQHQIQHLLAFDLVSLVSDIQISSNLLRSCILWLSNYLQSLIKIV